MIFAHFHSPRDPHRAYAIETFRMPFAGIVFQTSSTRPVVKHRNIVYNGIGYKFEFQFVPNGGGDSQSSCNTRLPQRDLRLEELSEVALVPCQHH